MAEIRFNVEADYSKVIRLREEIAQLENKLHTMGADRTASGTIKELEGNLASAKGEMDKVIDKTAKMNAQNIASAGSFDKVGAAIAGAFAVEKVFAFANRVANVRGEIQQLNMSFATMLGSQEKGEALMAELTKTAAVTPFNMKDVAGGAKQLLAFGIEAEKINDTLIRLGDIAAGTGAHVGQLTNVFGQIKAAGRMNGGDLLQFINAGVPIIKALADTMGVAESQVKELISAGKVGFPEVEAAIKSLTDEGAMFGGMMTNLSESITGKISTLEDNFDQMLNKIGEKSEAIMSGAIDASSFLIEHYEAIGKAILSLVATYGAYRAALVMVVAQNKIAIAIEQARTLTTGLATKAEKLHYLWLLLVEKAQIALNKAMLSNPFVLITTLLGGLVVGYLALRNEIDATAEAEKEVNGVREKGKKNAQEELLNIEALIKVAKDEKATLDDRQDAINKLNETIPNYNAQLDKTTGKYNENAQALSNYNKELIRKYEIEGAKERIVELGKQKAELVEKREEKKESARKVRKQMAAPNPDAMSSDIYDASALTSNAVEYTNSRYREAWEEYIADAKVLNTKIKALKDEFLSDMGKGLSSNPPNNGGGNTSSSSSSSAKKGSKNASIDEAKKAEQKAKEELLEIREKNNDDLISSLEEGFAKERAVVEREYAKKIDNIEALEEDFKALNKKSNATDLINGLTIEQYNELYKARQIAANKLLANLTKIDAEEEKERKDKAEAEEQAMRDYLIAYGTYEQKRLNLVEDYNAKIAEARKSGTQGEVLTLQAQMDDALKSLDTEHLKNGINWEQLFGDVTNKTTEKLVSLKEQLRGMLSNENLGMDDFSQIVDQIERINAAIQANQSNRKGVFFGWEQGNSYTQERDRLQKNKDDAMQTWSDASFKRVQVEMNPHTSKELDDAKKKEARAADALADANDALEKHISNVGKRFDGLLGDLSKWNANIQQLPDLASSLGVDKESEAGSKLQGVADIANNSLGAMKDFASGNYVGAAMKAVSAIGTLGDVLGVGGESDKTYNEDMAKLTDSNKALRESINALSEKMENSSLTEALDIYNKQVKNYETTEKNMKEQLSRSGASYNSGKWGLGFGGKHSTNYAIDKGMSDADWKAISEATGQNITKAGQLWQLDSETFAKIQTDATTQWIKLLDLADDGNKNAAQYMEEYANLYKLSEEAKRNYYEYVTSTSFDAMKDNFASSLLDMEKSATDFSKDFGEQLRKTVVNAKINDVLGKELEKFYDDWGAMSMDGLTEQEIEELKRRYAELTERGMQIRKETDELLGAGVGSQSASKGEYTAMSEDTGTEISGRLTAIQEGQIRADNSRGQMVESLVTMSGSLSQLAAQSVSISNIADDTRTILANSYLELQEINDNTGRTAKYLKAMQGDLNTIKSKL